MSASSSTTSTCARFMQVPYQIPPKSAGANPVLCTVMCASIDRGLRAGGILRDLCLSGEAVRSRRAWSPRSAPRSGAVTLAPTRMRTSLAILAAALAAAVAACGGDGGEDDAQFLSQVNAVCTDYGPRLGLLTPPAEDVEEWAATGADMADLLEASVNELRQLEAPESLEDDYAAWLEQRAAATSAMRDVQTAGGLHDEPAVEDALQQVEDGIAEADRIAAEAGFDDCYPTDIQTRP